MQFWLTVDQPWARLDPPAVEVLDQLLAFPDPEAEKSMAYLEGRWDGMARLYQDDGRFLSGHLPAVVAGLTQRGHAVEVIDNNPRPPINLSRVRRDYLHSDKEFWDHQYSAWITLMEAGQGICKIPTGGGKTRITAALARYLWEETGLRVLVIVPKSGLAVQSAAEFESYYNGEVAVGLLMEGRRDVGDITIATYQTLAGCMTRNVTKTVTSTAANGKKIKKKFKIPKAADPMLDALVKDIGILIIDEHHHTAAATIQSIARKCPAVFRYGFSATPLKHDVLDNRPGGLRRGDTGLDRRWCALPSVHRRRLS